MNNGILFEIAFYENDKKTSLSTFDALDIAQENLTNTLATHFDSTVILCEPAVQQSDIKSQHDKYPWDSIVLIKSDNQYQVVKKIHVINTGYVWSSESVKLVDLGTVCIAEIKLHPILRDRFVNLIKREESVEALYSHTIDIAKTMTKRQAQMDFREVTLAEWEYTLEQWEDSLYEKEHELALQQEKVSRSWVAPVTNGAELISVTKKVPPASKPKPVVTKSFDKGGYLSELTEYFKTYETRMDSDDNSYADYIDNLVNSNRTVFGKVKED